MRTWPAPHVPLVPGHGGAVRLHDPEAGRLLTVGGPASATVSAWGTTLAAPTRLIEAVSLVTLDVVVRALLDAGIDVTYVLGVDDADERLVERAAATGVEAGRLADEGLAQLGLDLAALGVIPPDRLVGAVETLPAVVVAVERLLESGAARRVTGDDEAGDVVADLEPCARGDAAAGSPEATAVLWRGARTDEPAWDGGALGPGRPGEHIACAAIVREHLGARVDLLAGRDDGVLAVVESFLRVLTGEEHPVARHLHLATVATSEGSSEDRSPGGVAEGEVTDGEVTVAGLLDRGVPPMAVRLLILAEHHRQDWTLTSERLDRATERLARWTEAFSSNGGPDVEAMVRDVRAALVDDLDTPRALRAVDTWVDEALALATAGRGVALEGAPGIASRVVDALLGVRM